jgi:hypothetical protein
VAKEDRMKGRKSHQIVLGNDDIRKLLKIRMDRIIIIFKVQVWNNKIQEITILRKV